MTRLLFIGLAFGLLVTIVSPATAQERQVDTPYYVVQEGDSLWNIAARFGVGMEDLQTANGITDPGQLSIGDELVIPGLEGYQGEVKTQLVPVGETLRSLSRRFGIPATTLTRLNRLASPAEIYAGSTLVFPAVSRNEPVQGRARLAPGQSLLELAALRGLNPWSIATTNQLPGSWSALPGDVLHLPEGEWDGPGALPEAIVEISMEPLPLVQGKTTVIKVDNQPGVSLSGSLAGRDLTFFPLDDGSVALQGIHAMAEPGHYPLNLKGSLPDGETFTFAQLVLLRDASYPFDPPLNVDPGTLDPAVTRPEDEQWEALGIPVTPVRMWDGPFKSPVPDQFKDCWTSLFGSRRSYNGSAYTSFHSGLDFCGTIGTELYAPAAGKVIFTEELAVRGNATVIDHGWGVYTAYDHQSEIFVKPGDLVEPGQPIGLGGATGRTTGPHLHWEVWVGGVQVDPVDWLESVYP
jgi:murein DD-endopeptidase MepM/ murein hydrolase activator NlpD